MVRLACDLFTSESEKCQQIQFNVCPLWCHWVKIYFAHFNEIQLPRVLEKYVTDVTSPKTFDMQKMHTAHAYCVPKTCTGHTHTTILQLSGLCPGQPGWSSTRRNIHPLTTIVVISHPLSASSIYLTIWTKNKDRFYTHGQPCVYAFPAHAHGRPCAYVLVAIRTADNSPGTHQTAPQMLKIQSSHLNN